MYLNGGIRVRCGIFDTAGCKFEILVSTTRFKAIHLLHRNVYNARLHWRSFHSYATVLWETEFQIRKILWFLHSARFSIYAISFLLSVTYVCINCTTLYETYLHTNRTGFFLPKYWVFCEVTNLRISQGHQKNVWETYESFYLWCYFLRDCYFFSLLFKKMCVALKRFNSASVVQ